MYIFIFFFLLFIPDAIYKKNNGTHQDNYHNKPVKIKNKKSQMQTERRESMTDYRLVESMQTDAPLEIDTASSPNVVYQRQNIKSVEAKGSEENNDYLQKS